MRRIGLGIVFLGLLSSCSSIGPNCSRDFLAEQRSLNRQINDARIDADDGYVARLSYKRGRSEFLCRKMEYPMIECTYISPEERRLNGPGWIPDPAVRLANLTRERHRLHAQMAACRIDRRRPV